MAPSPLDWLPMVFILLIGGEGLVRAFDQIEDVSDITWAHAVNSQAKLNEALNGPVLFLEADISLGYIRRPDHLSSKEEPIMAHPPWKESDISLDEWIAAVVERGNGSKGVKLDFKSTESTNASLEILNKWRDKVDFPLWLNADILPGPVDARNKPVDAKSFIELCRHNFPNATLSIGWTTNILADEERYRYTWNQVWTMARIIRCAEIDGLQPITYPIRAIFVQNSLPQLLWLVNTIKMSTITIWSSVVDEFDMNSLIELRKSLPLTSVYYDMPEEQLKAFNKLKRNVTYDPTRTISNKWGVLRDTTEPFGCEDETLISGNTVVYGGGRTVAVFNEEALAPVVNVTGKLYPYALADFEGDFSEREGAIAIVLADRKQFWSEGYWKTWQNLTSLAIGVHSPNHSESCCTVDFTTKTIMPDGVAVSKVRLNPCASSEPCMVYTDTSEHNLSSAKEVYLGFVFMGERAMVLDEIRVNGIPNYFATPVLSKSPTLRSFLNWLLFIFVPLLFQQWM